MDKDLRMKSYTINVGSDQIIEEEMTTFTTEDRIEAESETIATVTIIAKGNGVSVTTNGEGQALFIANLMVTLVDKKIAEANV
jgi:hypothetical protein